MFQQKLMPNSHLIEKQQSIEQKDLFNSIKAKVSTLLEF
jgi:hypothetical protein